MCHTIDLLSDVIVKFTLNLDIINVLLILVYPAKPQQSSMNMDDWGKLEGGFNNIPGAIYVPRNLKTTQDEDWDLSHMPIFQISSANKKYNNIDARNRKISIQNEIKEDIIEDVINDYLV